MKRIVYIIILSVIFACNAVAQGSLESILKSIEANNSTLKAYKEQANANRIGNKTENNLENPEVEFGYLWGSPSVEGNETDLSITQSFDFPTAYRYRSQLIKGKNAQVDLTYDEQRREVLQQARLLCVELVYQNQINKRLTERLDAAKGLSEAYKKLFELGNIDVLELNKTKLDLMNTEKVLQINEVEIAALMADLQRFNGGLAIENITTYQDYSLPMVFTEWIERVKVNSPSIRIADQVIANSKKQEQLTRALNLPKIRAGYASERILGTTHQGVTVGVSIPLWAGRNTVKHQKAQTFASRVKKEDIEMQFHNTLKGQYDKAIKLSGVIKNYEDMLSVTSGRELLKKALDAGQLSLINYLLELSVYYEAEDRYLEAQRDYHLSVAELAQWEE